jgi:hypothetical protein
VGCDLGWSFLFTILGAWVRAFGDQDEDLGPWGGASPTPSGRHAVPVEALDLAKGDPVDPSRRLRDYALHEVPAQLLVSQPRVSERGLCSGLAILFCYTQTTLSHQLRSTP